jgi:Zn-dependent peptidase ImmA (M78 family)/transcriptional regulator with XRE-family HTH domain
MTETMNRIALARRLRGRTRRELAAKIGVAESTFTYWEQNKRQPSPEDLTHLARELAMPQAFFLGESAVRVPKDTVSFRSLRTLLRRDRDRACARAELASELARWMSSTYNLPTVALPDLSDSPPVLAAAEMRRLLNLGNGPAPSIVAVLESIGVRCFSLGSDLAKADALSTWTDGIPLVLFNVKKSAERSRNDGAHELGHLVLHRHRSPAGDAVEQEAIAFAAEFLLPRESIVRDAPRSLTISSLLAFKKAWGVSAGLMLRRLQSLERISEWSARSLWQQLSAAGYRSGEPNGMARERSQVLTQVFEHQRTLGRRPFSAIAAALGFSTSDVRSLFEGLLPLEWHDGSAGEVQSERSQTSPNLRLMK